MPSINIVKKKPGEKVAVSMDFGNWLDEGETLETITSITFDVCTGNSDPTVTGESILGSRVVFFIEGGSEGIRYNVLITIVTSSGQILIGDGILQVT